MIAEEFKKFVPKQITRAYEMLKYYDFIHESKIDHEMQMVYEDMLNNKEKYVQFFELIGYEIIYGEGYIHINAKLNIEQSYRSAMKVAMQAYIIHLCSVQNTFIRNNEIVAGQSFSFTQLQNCIQNNQSLLSVIRNMSDKDEDDCIKSVISEMVRRRVLEKAPNGNIYYITPVYNYYRNFIFEAKKLLNDE